MKFRSIVDLIRAKGQRETFSQEFDQDHVILGRGGNSDIIYDSTLISLEHVRFSLRNSKLVVEDLDSLSGVRVNGRAVKRQELRAGDKIVLGDTELVIRDASPFWEVYEERHEKVAEDSSERLKRHLDAISIPKALPSMSLLSSLLVVLVFAIFFVVPLTDALNGTSDMTWSTGPMSTAHQMIENNCRACHSEPFQQVQDQSCESCHKMTEHAEAFSNGELAAKHSEVRCAECHMEHNGNAGMTLTSEKLCTDCHGDLKAVTSNAELRNISSFEAHPEFAVELPVIGADEDEFHRVELGDEEKLVDGARMKLNHRVHLEEGIAGPDGPITMQCDDCHHLTPTTTTFEPIRYERDCAACHTLEFDDRLPGNEVPHGDADTVYNYAYAEYAKLFLADEDAPPVPGFERFKPGKEPRTREDERLFVRNEVDEAARDAEELLFTKTACHLCHQVEEKTAEEFAADGETSGRFRVLTPNIPKVWMPKARFEHAAHQEIKCLSCHEGVTNSEETTDVLLPGVKKCQACHADSGEIGKIQSNCVMCHSYHDSVVLPEERKQEIKDITLMVSGE